MERSFSLYPTATITTPVSPLSLSSSSSSLPVSVHELKQKVFRILEALTTLPGNDICSECHAIRPRWASLSLGVFLCIRCAGIHRGLPASFSKVKSLDLQSWSVEEVLFLQNRGNRRVLRVYEHHCKSMHRPTSSDGLCKFIENKYVHRMFCSEKEDEREHLFASMVTNLPLGWIEFQHNSLPGYYGLLSHTVLRHEPTEPDVDGNSTDEMQMFNDLALGCFCELLTKSTNVISLAPESTDEWGIQNVSTLISWVDQINTKFEKASMTVNIAHRGWDLSSKQSLLCVQFGAPVLPTDSMTHIALQLYSNRAKTFVSEIISHDFAPSHFSASNAHEWIDNHATRNSVHPQVTFKGLPMASYEADDITVVARIYSIKNANDLVPLRFPIGVVSVAVCPVIHNGCPGEWLHVSPLPQIYAPLSDDQFPQTHTNLSNLKIASRSVGLPMSLCIFDYLPERSPFISALPVSMIYRPPYIALTDKSFSRQIAADCIAVTISIDQVFCSPLFRESLNGGTPDLAVGLSIATLPGMLHKCLIYGQSGQYYEEFHTHVCKKTHRASYADSVIAVIPESLFFTAFLLIRVFSIKKSTNGGLYRKERCFTFLPLSHVIEKSGSPDIGNLRALEGVAVEGKFNLACAKRKKQDAMAVTMLHAQGIEHNPFLTLCSDVVSVSIQFFTDRTLPLSDLTALTKGSKFALSFLKDLYAKCMAAERRHIKEHLPLLLSAISIGMKDCFHLACDVLFHIAQISDDPQWHQRFTLSSSFASPLLEYFAKRLNDFGGENLLPCASQMLQIALQKPTSTNEKQYTVVYRSDNVDKGIGLVLTELTLQLVVDKRAYAACASLQDCIKVICRHYYHHHYSISPSSSSSFDLIHYLDDVLVPAKHLYPQTLLYLCAQMLDISEFPLQGRILVIKTLANCLKPCFARKDPELSVLALLCLFHLLSNVNSTEETSAKEYKHHCSVLIWSLIPDIAACSSDDGVFSLKRDPSVLVFDAPFSLKSSMLHRNWSLVKIDSTKVHLHLKECRFYASWLLVCFCYFMFVDANPIGNISKLTLQDVDKLQGMLSACLKLVVDGSEFPPVAPDMHRFAIFSVVNNCCEICHWLIQSGLCLSPQGSTQRSALSAILHFLCGIVTACNDVGSDEKCVSDKIVIEACRGNAPLHLIMVMAKCAWDHVITADMIERWELFGVVSRTLLNKDEKVQGYARDMIWRLIDNEVTTSKTEVRVRHALFAVVCCFFETVREDETQRSKFLQTMAMLWKNLTTRAQRAKDDIKLLLMMEDAQVLTDLLKKVHLDHGVNTDTWEHETVAALMDLIEFIKQFAIEGLHSQYVERLVSIHVQCRNFYEAGASVLLMASSAVAGGSSNTKITEKDGTLIHRAISLFNTGQHWESSLQLVERLKDPVNMKQMECMLHQQMMTGGREYPRYLWVGVNDGMGEILNWILRANVEETTVSLLGVLRTKYPELSQIQSPFPVTAPMPLGYFVFEVQGGCEEEKSSGLPLPNNGVPEYAAVYKDLYNLKLFVHEQRSATKNTMRLTFLGTDMSLPSITRQCKVIDMHQVVLSPARAALRQVLFMNNTLERQIEAVKRFDSDYPEPTSNVGHFSKSIATRPLLLSLSPENVAEREDLLRYLSSYIYCERGLGITQEERVLLGQAIARHRQLIDKGNELVAFSYEDELQQQQQQQQQQAQLTEASFFA